MIRDHPRRIERHTLDAGQKNGLPASKSTRQRPMSQILWEGDMYFFMSEITTLY
jgi:hypothetical protein